MFYSWSLTVNQFSLHVGHAICTQQTSRQNRVYYISVILCSLLCPEKILNWNPRTAVQEAEAALICGIFSLVRELGVHCLSLRKTLKETSDKAVKASRCTWMRRNCPSWGLKFWLLDTGTHGPAFLRCYGANWTKH